MTIENQIRLTHIGLPLHQTCLCNDRDLSFAQAPYLHIHMIPLASFHFKYLINCSHETFFLTGNRRLCKPQPDRQILPVGKACPVKGFWVFLIMHSVPSLISLVPSSPKPFILSSSTTSNLVLGTSDLGKLELNKPELNKPEPNIK